MLSMDGSKSGRGTTTGSRFGKLVPDDIVNLLDEPCLIPGENPEDYSRLFGALAAEVEPTSFVEWRWLKDAVDWEWEARRLRNAKARLLTLATSTSAKDTLTALLAAEGKDYNPRIVNPEEEGKKELEAARLLVARQKGDLKAAARIQRLLGKAGLNEDAISAIAIRQSLDLNDKMDGMTAANNRRRDQALRDIELRREMLAARPRSSAPRVIDAVNVKAG